MFCLAALLPAAAVLWMGQRAASQDAEAAAEHTLRLEAKRFAMGAYARLDLARQALASPAVALPLDARSRRFLGPYFSEVVVFDPAAPPAAVPGSLEGALRGAAPGLSPSVSLLVLERPRTGGMHDVVLLRWLPRGGRNVLLAGRLRPGFLWGLPEEFGGSTRICAAAAARPLFCGGPPATAFEARRLRTVDWTLFLRPGFGAADWTFRAQAERPRLAGQSARLLVPVVVGVLLLAMLLSSVQIRRVLVPLDALLGKIRALGGGAPLDAASSRDEFELLSHTFDGMGVRIGQQMETLHALADVDRLILARVPLADVLEVVLARLQHVLGRASVCLVVASGDDVSPPRCRVLGRDAARTQDLVLQAMPQAPAATDAAGPSRGGWWPVESLAADAVRAWLEGDGATCAWVQPIGTGDGVDASASALLLLGYADAAQADAGTLAQAADLAERVAVATAFERHEAQLVHQARHDLLTGLPNRLATFEALAAHIDAVAMGGAGFAVAFLDLDRFKSINDGLGHAFGDELLVETARRLRASLAGADFVGRFGGDEFFVILPGATSREAVLRTMERLDAALQAPIAIGQREFHQRFSAGVAFHPADGADAAALIRNADMAMYRVKQAGGGRAGFFAAEMDLAAQERMQLESDLRVAIQERAIVLHYQPRVDSRSGRMVGMEALARWTHPRRGAISPQVFVGLAEECGLVEALGELVLDEACRQVADWHAQGLRPPRVGVNISGHQLRTGGLVPALAGALERHGLDPGSLEIEVTETMLVRDAESGARQLQQARALGLKVAIDDFGTGYSSLAYLTRLPSDTLKIDRAFVVDLQRGDPAVEAVVRSIIGIGRDLGKGIVAEGVESLEQVRILGGWGCHVIQGYVYARPLPPRAIGAILAGGGLVSSAGASG